MYQIKKNDNVLIAYHRDMDGFASEVAIKSLGAFNGEFQSFSVQYNEWFLNNKNSFMDYLTEKELVDNNILFIVDFSFGKDLTIELSKVFDQIIIIDHHKTTKEILNDQDIKDIKNIEMYFDMDKSGATMCWDYAQEIHKSFGIDLDNVFQRNYFQYVQDRDLLTWKLKNSKEFSEGLNHLMNLEKDISRPEAFRNIINKHTIPEIIDTGKLLVLCTNNLPDVSKIAIDSDGGGHKKAGGFQMGLKFKIGLNFQIGLKFKIGLNFLIDFKGSLWK